MRKKGKGSLEAHPFLCHLFNSKLHNFITAVILEENSKARKKHTR